MNDTKEVEYYKDLEYITHCADGALLQCDGINGKLIFFQDELNLTLDGKTDTTKDNRNYYLK